MLAKTTMMHTRIECDLKCGAETVFSRLGLKPSEAIRLFYKQVELHKGLPFEVKIPNAVTRKTFADTNRRIGLTHYKSIDDMFRDLEM